MTRGAALLREAEPVEPTREPLPMTGRTRFMELTRVAADAERKDAE